MSRRAGAARGWAALAAMVVALAAAGCSDDGGDGQDPRRVPRAPAAPAEAKAIRAAVVRLFQATDVRVVCERSLTPRLFRMIFTGPAACRKATADDDVDPPRGCALRASGPRAGRPSPTPRSSAGTPAEPRAGCGCSGKGRVAYRRVLHRLPAQPADRQPRAGAGDLARSGEVRRPASQADAGRALQAARLLPDRTQAGSGHAAAPAAHRVRTARRWRLLRSAGPREEPPPDAAQGGRKP